MPIDEGSVTLDLTLTQVNVERRLAFQKDAYFEQIAIPVRRFEGFLELAQTGGDIEMETQVFVIGQHELEESIFVYSEQSDFSQAIEVYQDECNLYQSGNTLLKYLPAEFEVQDVSEDLKQFLHVVAISMDEFYCFIEDFTTIFDPDLCPEAYLPYLAKLINYPLNTRGMDSLVPAIKEAAILRSRRQLRQAVEVYKRKGLKEAFQILFYGLGYYIELVELWTQNYVTFHPEVPATATLYHPVTNPRGWYKSPYFGIKLISINQQSVCTDSTSGAGQPWSFDTEDLQEITEAINLIRPVHTVLWWLDYYFDMCDKFDQWNDVPTISDIEWVPDERLDYMQCEPDDPIYFRGDPHAPTNPALGDPRLTGVVRAYLPQTDPTKPGPTVEGAVLKRIQYKGICHPGETLVTEIGTINWSDEPWCTQVFRRAGEAYRDGYNFAPRDGSQPHRDPTAFGGRNGYYNRDTPLAPFPSSLVPDRNGCYLTDQHLLPLYQIAEEAEDGVILYYNSFEFQKWLDSIVTGVGPDPEMSMGNPSLATVAAVGTGLSVTGNVVVALSDDVWSLFGSTSQTGATSAQIVRMNFVSGLLNSVSVLTPTGAQGRTLGYAAVLGTQPCYVYGFARTFNGTTWDSAPKKEMQRYDPSTNSCEIEPLSTFRRDAAAAQVGNTLYVFGGFDENNVLQQNYVGIGLSGAEDGATAAPFTVNGGCAVAVNEYIYIYTGTTGQLWRFNSTTQQFTQLANAPSGATVSHMFARNSFIYVYVPQTSNWSGPLDQSNFIEYNTTTGSWATRVVTLSNGNNPLPPTVAKSGRFYGTGALKGSNPQASIQAIAF